MTLRNIIPFSDFLSLLYVIYRNPIEYSKLSNYFSYFLSLFLIVSYFVTFHIILLLTHFVLFFVCCFKTSFFFFFRKYDPYPCILGIPVMPALFGTCKFYIFVCFLLIGTRIMVACMREI